MGRRKRIAQEKRTCPTCKIEFPCLVNSTQKFCSKKCRRLSSEAKANLSRNKLKGKRGEYIHKLNCKCACCMNHKNKGIKKGPHRLNCRCVSCAAHQNKLERDGISGKI